MKAREQVEELKRNWKSDPSWDIENSEGFEDYRDELFAYRLEVEAEWSTKQRQKNADYLLNGPASETMTLRDWFAGQALVGLTAHPEGSGGPACGSEAAYSFADSMMEARERKEPPQILED